MRIVEWWNGGIVDARTFRVCLHTVCHMFYGAISKFLAHILYVSQISNDMNIQARFARNNWFIICNWAHQL